MKILNLYRSQPVEIVKQLTAGMAKGDQVSEVPLYKGNVDYAKLVKDIFENDRVICWW